MAALRTRRQRVLVAGLLAVMGACTCAAEHDLRGDGAVIDDGAADGATDALPQVDARAAREIPPDCRAAADRGVAWLATRQNVDGSWGAVFKTASTGFAVLALETYAVETGLSPFDPAFTHAERVTRGLDFLMDQARRVPIEAQLYGNPDSNGNGRGISFSTIDQQMYENAIVTMAIAAGTEPDRVVESSGSPVVGLTFREVVEDAVDYLAMAQSDAPSTAMGCARGGWTYRPINRGPAQGDNSVTQFVALALAYARHPRYRYQIATRPWVLDELSRFVSCVQHDGGFADGGSGYRGPDENVNAYKTGGLLQELAFLRRPIADLHVVSALTYLQRTWTDAVVGWNQVELADKLAMYSIMNGMESLAIDDLGPIDWYRGFCDELKTEQLADGSWPASGSDWEIIEPTAPVPPGLHSTLWALLVLERAAPPPEVIP